MLESIKFSLARKLQDKKIRNLVLRERVCQETLVFLQNHFKTGVKSLQSLLNISFDLKTRVVRIYIKDQRLYTNILIYKLDLLNFFKKKFPANTIKSVSVLKKF